jgi:hypothetical protein
MRQIVAFNLAVFYLWCMVLPVSVAQTLDPLLDYRFQGQVVRRADGTIQRSAKIVNAFKKTWACPSTGRHEGACPGWAVDHVIPLACGGADAVWNMQWLPEAMKSSGDPHSKDRFERWVYGGRGMSQGCM